MKPLLNPEFYQSLVLSLCRTGSWRRTSLSGYEIRAQIHTLGVEPKVHSLGNHARFNPRYQWGLLSTNNTTSKSNFPSICKNF
jgi:hypothetical protein